jgi:hypothetical protein
VETPQLRLAELLSALSFALDMVEGQPAGHCVRCCWIAMHIGREAGLSESQLRDLYYTMLIKDVGCSSNAARICQIYMIDDITFKRDLMTVNGSLPQVLRFVLSHTGMNAGLADRFRALVNVFQNGGKIRCVSRRTSLPAFEVSMNTGMAAACRRACAAKRSRSTRVSR